MKLFSAENLLSLTMRKHMFRMKTLEYEDIKNFRIPCALRNKTVPRF